jgi:hypothetical protein
LEKSNERLVPCAPSAFWSVAADHRYGRSGELAAVQRDHVVGRAEAAHGDLRAFAVGAVDRHARDALQRFRQVGVGKFADVLCRDRVDDARRLALDRDRALQAGTDTGNNDFLAVSLAALRCL